MNLTVEDLISGDCPSEFEDKLFMYASSVKKENDVIEVHVNNKNLTTFEKSIDAKPITELLKPHRDNDNNNDPLIKGLENILISSGSFLFINNDLILKKRTNNAVIDPNKWTSPAGRCDRTPLITALKETAEEITVFCKKTETFIYPEGSEKFVKKNIKNSFISYELSNDSFKIELNKIRFYLDGVLTEETELWYYYDSKQNTLELRLPIFYTLDETNIEVSNPEYLDSETELFDMSSLPEDEHLVSVIQQLKHPPHIFYLTGLSLDKQKWDKTYSDALYDDTDYGDFINFQTKRVKRHSLLKKRKLILDIIIFCSFVIMFFSLFVDHLSSLEALVKLIYPPLFDFLKDNNILIFITSTMLGLISLLLNKLKKKSSAQISKIVEEISNDMNSSSYIYTLFNHGDAKKNTFEAFLKESEKSNFKSELFGFYLSNQGDVRGLNPLSAIGTQDSRFTVSWAYTDFVYYKNEFIDVVSLTIPYSFLKKLTRNKSKNLYHELKKKYISHGLEILLARGRASYLKNNRGSKIEEINSKRDKKKIEYLTKKLNGRNLFGISLLSSILYYLDDAFSKSVEPSSTTDIDRVSYLLNIAGNPESNYTNINNKEDFKVKLIVDQIENKKE